MGVIEVVFAVLPFILLLVLVVWRRWTTLRAMPLVWFVTAAILFTYWKVDLVLISASFVRGLFIAIEIILIIFGAVWVVQIVREKRHLGALQSFLSSISDDARIQVLIIAWLFGSLIEGVAGFGTPAMLAAPLLVSLGFAPILAVVVSLIANSTPVSFGAAGLPVGLGIGSFGFGEYVMQGVTSTVASLHFIVGLIVPLVLVWFVVSHKGGNKFKRFFETVPFAILTWLCFVVPYFLVARLIGSELPTIVGGVVGLFAVIGAAKTGFLVPKHKLRFGGRKVRRDYSQKSIFLSILPYLLIVLFLGLSRVVPFLRDALRGVSIGQAGIFGTGLSYEFLPLFAPSFFIILAGVVTFLVYRGGFDDMRSTLNHAWKRVRLPFVALIFALALVQLFLVSGEGRAGIGSMPLVLAQGVSALFNEGYVFVSPLIGTFGSFLAGSNTVSNLLFGSFQAETASLLGMSLVLILSLQVVGGAVGNMISIHNVLAASSTVGLYGEEGRIIRKTIVIALIYVLLVGLLGWLLL